VTPKAFVKQREFASAVAEVERILGPDVIRIRHTLENDWSGEPAVFFRIILSDAASKRDRLLHATNHISNTIERQIEPLEQWGVLPYFNFRSQSEQIQLNEPAWA